jgi:hypothetical protein
LDKRNSGKVDNEFDIRLPFGGKVWTSQSPLPDVIVAFRMNQAQDRNDVPFNQEDDAIGKAVRKHPTHGVPAMSNGVKEGILRQPCNGLADFIDELSTESRISNS